MINLGIIAERIKNARISRNLSLEEAAEITGYSVRTLRRYEAEGLRDLVTLDDLCTAYGAVITDIIGGQNDLAYLEAAIRRLGPNSCGIICGICKSLGWK
ncbi:MAG: hypothetical protein DBP02_15245 [gamma proteobacterium symbiont of Ctena orbiculata]|nr:MAG: hypothetical protein DBP02_15245 [gamma proteobacterium symbiont of Ctena orbiculata]